MEVKIKDPLLTGRKLIRILQNAQKTDDTIVLERYFDDIEKVVNVKPTFIDTTLMIDYKPNKFPELAPNESKKVTKLDLYIDGEESPIATFGTTITRSVSFWGEIDESGDFVRVGEGSDQIQVEDKDTIKKIVEKGKDYYLRHEMFIYNKYIILHIGNREGILIEELSGDILSDPFDVFMLESSEILDLIKKRKEIKS